MPKGDGVADGGNARLSRSSSAWVAPVKFWKPGITPEGTPVSRIATRSARVFPLLLRASRLGKIPG